MKALIVYAHPREVSFSKAVLDRTKSTLEKNGHQVEVRDLYKMNFNPILSRAETIHVEKGKFIRENSNYPTDVLKEQQLILESDLLIYIFPIWWNGMPAIMKGYVDRVFAHGFAYSFEDDEPKKRFNGKRALFFTPTGQPQNENGELTPIDQAIKLLTSEWMFQSNGVEVIDHVFYGRVPYLTEEELSVYLDDVESRMNQIN
ncbi:NAD(P)H-dependent oxidoreductase [Enterococcus sp. CWB-B31]|uniref:NAD(P)H-dependent oxidoreductase n=1 Tax=Enterococcus sp. CWB-B31 TaxID=2885159 RepID=UPI001E42A4A2|nr:NAD(P)H-dependent oxidoreductase [Enterococcus sp. CWB-B31]MCB5955958.1 NAD(P)H-dependent oxidoreductase [Enterococcus sp. CWB-B31]